MKIPRKHIESQRKFVSTLEDIEYIHYRDLHKNIDTSNFQICTKVDFKAVGKAHENILETFGRLNNENTVVYEFKSKSGSQYFINDKGDVYRLSNHWGAVASCEWTREGQGELRMSIFIDGDWEIGVANLKDFKIFRRKDDRRVDIILNPLWVKKMKTIIPTRKKLAALKCSPDFKDLPAEDKKYIGENYGYFTAIIKTMDDVII
jgi:hypothetical protein